MRRRAIQFLALAALGFGAIAGPRVVIIGGPKSEGAARHEYPEGVRLMRDLLAASADAQALDLAIDAYPEGWPSDPDALDGAATIVWYFDGLERHPLREPARRASFEAAMRRGTGLVALHQSFSVSSGEDLGLDAALGGQRVGMADRVTQRVALAASTPSHALSRGAASFAYHDELFPSIRWAAGEGRITPILHAEGFTAAWAYERAGGGRSFAYSGTHYLLAFDQPALVTTLLNAIFWTAHLEVPRDGVRTTATGAAMARVRRALASVPDVAAAHAAAVDTLTFHRDPQRTGWHSGETTLTPASVAGPAFGLLWESPPLGEAARLYASPLYVDQVLVRGEPRSVVLAATNAGRVYAIAARASRGAPAGAVLWQTALGEPCHLQPAPLDGVPTGVLATPVVDLARKRVYVTSCVAGRSWQAFALELESGAVAKGWPVALDEATFNTLNRNAGPAPVAPARRFDFRVQRGALNLSPDGAFLYVTFGETETGWLVSIDTSRARVASAFASVSMPHRGSGGLWGAGGAAVDRRGNVFVATGTGFDGYRDQPHDWTQSLLMLSHDAGEGFTLRGTYTPFNHCATAANDIDLGSGGVALLPDLDWAATATPQLAVVGGKQGNVYLLDRARLPGGLMRRPPCSTDAGSDGSLVAPQPQPQFNARGPLNVFGPYSEKDAALDQARARSVPAYFRDGGGMGHVFVTGTSKRSEGSSESVPPTLARLAVVTEPGEPAYLRLEQAERTTVLHNPGSPLVSSNGARDAIVWVLDENAPRSAPLVGEQAPRPVLHAFDAMTLAPLWHSRPGDLRTSGKYNEPAIGRGTVFVGTDRIQAFGVGTPLAPRASVVTRAGTARQEPNAARAPDGAALYARRCAACHDDPQGSVPPRARLAQRSHAYLVDVLTTGAMQAQAAGLDAAEIDAVARYLR